MSAIKRVSRYALFRKGFKEAFKLVPRDMQSSLVKTLQERIGWSQATFYNRLNGFCPVKPVEREILEESFLEFGIDIWSATKN
jgi:hypothetical protein